MKLPEKTLPNGHVPDDFSCFGPVAAKDGVFEGTMIADLGCFTQDGKDSNKSYHGAVVQSKKTQKWYAYFEWGRTDAGKPSFQFVECYTKEEAQHAYCQQMHSKNDKRGEWFDHPTLGKILRARSGKDCYLVRQLAARSTGLPDAQRITQAGANQKVVSQTKTTQKKGPSLDGKTLDLLSDLNMATVSYARTVMTGAAIPTQQAIEEARDILAEAQKRLKVVGSDVQDQVNDSDLKMLTNMIYSRIPKKKDRFAAPEKWILSSENIFSWGLDLDAFENASIVVETGEQENPLADMKIDMRWLPPKENEFIYNWIRNATRGKHKNMDDMKVHNIWEYSRHEDQKRFLDSQKKIAAEKPRWNDPPMFQPKSRPDIENAKLYSDSGTALLIHGTRSVNVGGILRESWRLPKQLVGVVINNAMFGPGIYWADDWKKSAQYASLGQAIYSKGSGGVQRRGAFLFLADVVLGKMYEAPAAKGFTEAPSGHHSVFGKKGYSEGWHGALLNNEFIVYSNAQCRGRYLVEFEA